MSDTTLGKILAGTENRDAIHVAIAPVQAGGHLAPGWHVGLEPDGKASINATPHIGIVDPFLTHGIESGQWFYLCLYQQTVTGMRHHWSHPAFADGTPAGELQASIDWLRSAADELGVSYEDLISDYGELATGDYINNGEDIRDAWYGLSDEFWKHRKVVTGKDVDEANRGGFTCSC